MGSIPSLGRLEKVDARAVWESEPQSFTPWLAKNLEVLGEALGLELELEAVEQAVGPFRADILCKQVGSDHWVLIENQLERTDHPHLGQVLTYAAGLDAVTVVWISPSFTDEHRACLDWLNRVTVEGLNFFGVQVEVWRIGESLHAPRFNVVSQPNAWTKSVAGATTALGASELAQTRQEYWTAFGEVLTQLGTRFRIGKPTGRTYMLFSVFGRREFGLNMAADSERNRIRVELYIDGKEARGFFAAIAKDRARIEASLGKLDWHDTPKEDRTIRLFLDGADIRAREDWPRQHAWLGRRLYEFYDVFAPIVKTIQPLASDQASEPDAGPGALDGVEPFSE